MEFASITDSIMEDSFRDFKNDIMNSATLKNGTMYRKEFLQKYIKYLVRETPLFSILHTNEDFCNTYSKLIRETSLCANEYSYFIRILEMKSKNLFSDMIYEIERNSLETNHPLGVNIKRFVDFMMAENIQLVDSINMREVLQNNFELFIADVE